MGANQYQYKIKKKLGEGGFGEVYLIEKDQKEYALKKIKAKLDEKDVRQITMLIDILSKINSRYIIKYYYTFKEKDSFNIIMENAGDKNLKQFINEYKTNAELIPEYIILDIIYQLVKGLQDIHKNNLIHRDLTPDNIFIDEKHKIKIGDFGITKILTETNKYTRSQIGKIHYIAPEMELGEKYNNKVDIYSLGCIIYELFTLDEYYFDKKIHEKECKINIEIYDSKWQELIDLLVKKNYHQRPDIEQVYNFIANDEIIKSFIINEENENKDKENDKTNESVKNKTLLERIELNYDQIVKLKKEKKLYNLKSKILFYFIFNY